MFYVHNWQYNNDQNIHPKSVEVKTMQDMILKLIQVIHKIFQIMSRTSIVFLIYFEH